MVPDGWKRKRLGAIATLQRGFDLPKKARRAGKYPVISSGGVSGCHNEAKASAPGVVTGRYGSIGDVFFISEDFWPLNTALWIKDFHGNDHKFVYYLLSRINFSKFSDKTGVPGINRNDIHAVKSLLPPVPEQRNIATILSIWDKTIEITEKLIENSKAQKKALMQQLLTGKMRLPGFSDEWRHPKASEIFKAVSDRNNVDEDLLSVTQDQGVVPRSHLERKVVMPEGATTNYKLVLPGNFVISLRSFQGGLEYSRHRGLVSPAYTVLKPVKPISDSFYRHYFKSYEFIGRLAITVIGIRDGKQISYRDFAFLRLPCPSTEEQTAISIALDTAEAEHNCLSEQLACLREEKKALMQQLLTGKRRVKVAA